MGTECGCITNMPPWKQRAVYKRCKRYQQEPVLPKQATFTVEAT